MTDQKPPEITDEDWNQTPSAVRVLLAQANKRIKQFEAQARGIQERLGLGSRLPQKSVNDKDHAPPVSNTVRGGKLLIVDDNEMNRDMLSRRLERQGYTVEMAENGREALEMIQSKQFDLMLLDIMMPEMNGYQVLEHLKADARLNNLPVIMVSAVDDIESVVRCVELGAEDYLFKPFNPILLKARVGASLEKKWLRDQQEASMLQLDIENRRQSDELERARKIQLAMLPTAPPTLPYLDIAARQETASEVGGDYYDFFPLADDKLRVAIGDATGHGAASGLMVSMTKASLLATDETGLLTLPQKINTILNKIDLGTQLNMALLLLEFSKLQTGHVAARAIGGGTPPIYIWRAGGNLEEILISGFPLGVIDSAVYDPIEFNLASGDVVLLMSDGLSEMFNINRQILGYERLIAALERIKTSGAPADKILQQVAQVGNDWAKGHPLYDDVTLVVIKIK